MTLEELNNLRTWGKPPAEAAEPEVTQHSRSRKAQSRSSYLPAYLCSHTAPPVCAGDDPDLQAGGGGRGRGGH